MNPNDYVPLRDVSRVLPGNISIATLHRWKKHGVRGVRLETVMIGGRRYVGRSALEAFVAQSTAAVDGTPAPTRTPGQREKAILAAEHELAQM